jgi:hypothetical protein
MSEEIRREMIALIKKTYSLFATALKTGNPADLVVAVEVGAQLVLKTVKQFPSLLSPELVQDFSEHLRATKPTLRSVYGTFGFVWSFLGAVLLELRKELRT